MTSHRYGCKKAKVVILWMVNDFAALFGWTPAASRLLNFRIELIVGVRLGSPYAFLSKRRIASQVFSIFPVASTAASQPEPGVAGSAGNSSLP